MASHIGLDLSLTGSAGVMLDETGSVVRVLAFSTSSREVVRYANDEVVTLLHSPEVRAGDARASWQRTVWVSEKIRLWLARYVVEEAVVAIEDHAWGAKGAAVYQLGHLHGLTRRVVQQRDLPFLLVEPTALKRAATGSGSADKAAMVAATVRAGFDVVARFSASTRHNVADAYWLAQLMRSWCLLRADGAAKISPTMRAVLLPGKRTPGLLARECL